MKEGLFILALIVSAGAAECMCDSLVAAVIAVTCLVVMIWAERRITNA